MRFAIEYAARDRNPRLAIRVAIFFQEERCVSSIVFSLVAAVGTKNELLKATSILEPLLKKTKKKRK